MDEREHPEARDLVLIITAEVDTLVILWIHIGQLNFPD
jgi:hypothetical protein